MSNGKCNEDEDRILRNHDAFIAEPTLDGKVMRLGENFRDGRLDTVRRFASLYRRLPWRPWMLSVMASIGILGAATMIWAASSFHAEVKQNEKDTVCAQTTADAAKEQAHKLGEATAAANAKLDMLLEARGIRSPGRDRIQASMRNLGIVPDSTKQDSIVRNPEP